MCPGGASGGGSTKRAAEQPGASEPEQNPKNSLQHIEKLSVVRFQQEIPLVQMLRKRVASEPCIKAESSSQPSHNKRIAGLSATVPEVQIPTGFGCHRLQMCLGGTSERGIPERSSRTAHASEPRSKAESGSQTAHNKRVARLSVTMPVVQMPAGFGTQRNANVPRRRFWRGGTKRAAEQPGHLNRKEIQEIHCNTLRNFTLRGFNRHLPWFRCSEKGSI